MIEVDTVVLEDNKEYAIMDTIPIDGVKYIYMCQLDNAQALCIRKLSSDEKNILSLKDEAEFKMALHAYVIKYKPILTEE